MPDDHKSMRQGQAQQGDQAELRRLPPDLPVPRDDGAAVHLIGARIPQVSLVGSRGTTVDLAACTGWLVLYCYPRMAKTMADVPQGWSAIPGASGCTVQSLKYNDELAEFDSLGVTVFGVSTESPDAQRDAISRLGLNQTLLSDAEERLSSALRLPAFEIDGRRYLRRLTLCAFDGDIAKVWYPVFPPGQDVAEAKAWLAERSGLERRPSTSPGDQ